MTIRLSVFPHEDRNDIDFSSIILKHIGCDGKEMKHRRKLESSVHELRCSCGLKIEVPIHGDAQLRIVCCAIDEQQHQLAEGSVYSETAGSVILQPARHPPDA